MTLHSTPSSESFSPAHSAGHALNEAALSADRRAAQAARAPERARPEAARAPQGSHTSALGHARRLAGRADPLVDRLSNRAQQLARHSLDLAAHAGSKAQASWANVAETTHSYVARQPVRSVLVAAAVGAGLALLLAAARKRG